MEAHDATERKDGKMRLNSARVCFLLFFLMSGCIQTRFSRQEPISVIYAEHKGEQKVGTIGQVAGFDDRATSLLYFTLVGDGPCVLARVSLDQQAGNAGKIKEITDRPAQSWIGQFCALSPDASKMAYLLDGRSVISVMPISGGNPPRPILTESSSIECCPLMEWTDSRVLICCISSRLLGARILLLDTDRAESRDLFHLSGEIPPDVHDFSVSPDHTRLAFCDRAGEVQSLNLLDIPSGTIRRLMTHDLHSKNITSPTWNPDGSSLGYIQHLRGSETFDILNLATNRVEKTIRLKKHLGYNPSFARFLSPMRLCVFLDTEGTSAYADVYDTASGNRTHTVKTRFPVSYCLVPQLEGIARGY